jgi:curved DNA-binding protein CbpA
MEQSEKLDSLYKAMICAKYEYLCHLRTVYEPKFQEETQNYIFDIDHWSYKFLIHPCDVKGASSAEAKTLYKSLTKLLHPDKCNSEVSNKAFVYITDAYQKNDIDCLKKLSEHLKDHNLEEFEFNIQTHSKEDDVKMMESSFWYNWYFTDKSGMLKDVFTTPEIVKERLRIETEKLEKENEQLRKTYERLGIHFGKANSKTSESVYDG